MKVLFLDIDGVLNTPGGELGWNFVLGRNKDNSPDWKTVYGTCLNYLSESFCVASLYNLYRIVEETGCKIVISSSWRHGETVESMKKWFPSDLLKDAIIDKTPSFDMESHPHLGRERSYTDNDGVKHTYKRVERGDEILHYVNEHKEIVRYAAVDDDDDMTVIKDNFFETDAYIGLDWHTADKVIEHLNK